MAKIAVELETAVARRAATGEPGGMASRVLGEGDGWHVADVVCTCGPQDRRFEEQHSFFTIAVVLAGTFQYRGSLNRSGNAQELMTPGSLLLGNAGQCFECGHEHALGDRCLSFRYSPEYFERLTADARISRGQRSFGMLRLPPLQPLSPVLARACAGMLRASETSWEEVSVQLATEALKLVHGLPVATSRVPPSTLARVTRAVRMIEGHADGALPLGNLAREAGLSPYHFLRTFEQLTGVTRTNMCVECAYATQLRDWPRRKKKFWMSHLIAVSAMFRISIARFATSLAPIRAPGEFRSPEIASPRIARRCFVRARERWL